MATKLLLLVMALGVTCSADLRAQSGGRDLPRGFRSLAGVTLNRDSAATIRAKLGDTRERNVGTGHDRFASWCYVRAEGRSRVVLELMSDASDMGTPGRVLNVIRLRAEVPADERRGCGVVHASAALSTPAGLRLGLSRLRVRALLGPPTRQSADSLIYLFDAKEYMRPGSPEYETWNTPEHRESCFDAGLPYVNVAATVIVLFRDGHAIEIRIERYDQSVC
jgi:hypothetical protein